MGHSRTIQKVDLMAESKRLAALAKNLVRGPDSEDLVQDTLVKALSQEHAPTSIGPWLRQVLRNRAREKARSEIRRRAREEKIEVQGEQLPSTEDQAFKAEVLSALLKALKQVDEPYQSVLKARFLDEKSSKEIAEEIQVVPATVRWRIHEGLRQLREELDLHFGGRSHWLGALAIFFAIPVDAEAGIASTTNHSLFDPTTHQSGAIKMSTILKIKLGAALGGITLGVSFACANVLMDSDPESSQPNEMEGLRSGKAERPGLFQRLVGAGGSSWFGGQDDCKDADCIWEAQGMDDCVDLLKRESIDKAYFLEWTWGVGKNGNAVPSSLDVRSGCALVPSVNTDSGVESKKDYRPELAVLRRCSESEQPQHHLRFSECLMAAQKALPIPPFVHEQAEQRSENGDESFQTAYCMVPKIGGCDCQSCPGHIRRVAQIECVDTTWSTPELEYCQELFHPDQLHEEYC